MNKKAVFNSNDYGVEALGLIILIIGFIFALLAQSAVISYILILLAGGIFGRVWFKIPQGMKLAIGIIIIFFLAGFLLGSYFYGSWIIKMISFILGIAIAYYLHSKRIIRF